MRNALIQTLILGGGYFIVSSLFAVFSNTIGSAFALMFPLFVVAMVILSFVKRTQKIVMFRDTHPDLSLLLCVLGAYAYIYFAINFYGILLESLTNGNDDFVSSLLASYNDWYDILDTLLSFSLVIGVMISVFIILYKNVKVKK